MHSEFGKGWSFSELVEFVDFYVYPRCRFGGSPTPSGKAHKGFIMHGLDLDSVC